MKCHVLSEILYFVVTRMDTTHLMRIALNYVSNCDPLSENPSLPANIEFELVAILSSLVPRLSPRENEKSEEKGRAW